MTMRGKHHATAALILLSLFLALLMPAAAAFADTVPPPPDKSGLETALSDAAAAKSGVRPSTDGKDVRPTDLWASQSAFNGLNASVDLAKQVLADAGATQDRIDLQTQALRVSIAEFQNACSYGTKNDSATPEREYIDKVYLKDDEPAGDGKTHFVGEDFDKKYKTPEITAKGKTMQLNAYYTTNKSDGNTYAAADDAAPLGRVAITWSSSDMNIATVSPNGLIIPVSDGDVTITATIAEEGKYTGETPKKSVLIKISGQTGAYVKSVKIIDEKGNSLSSKDDADTIIKGKNVFYQFYAMVTWYDPVAGSSRTEDTRTQSVSSTITWSVGGSSVAGTINKDTGRFKSGEYSGNCFVQCAVTGGQAGKTVKDTARVQVDTGEYSYKPADSLKLKVVYQEFPDKPVQESKYSLDDLKKKLTSYTHQYTVLGGTRYGTIMARGYLYKDIVALEGIDIDDVYQFRFTTADGYDNPITAKLLYGSGKRYFFPNWDIGSRAGAKVVPPMLATESSMIWGESALGKDTPLDESSRFRLVFGPLWSGDTNSSFQIYYIQAITIVMKGAPPADNGEGEGNESGDGDGGKGEGTGGGTGTGLGSGDVGGVGGTSTGKSEVGTSSSGGSSGVGNNPAGGSIDKKPGNPGGSYKIYEMISNSRSSVMPLDLDLPYLPAAIPIACGGVVCGGLTFFIGFRRRIT